MISAKMILDSVSPGDTRISTLELCYPKFIHGEFMTHRMFSRNASSSRAVPVMKMIEMIRTNPATPVSWGENQPGMQASKEVGESVMPIAQAKWLEAAKHACEIAEEMAKLNIHKQVVNRITEPFAHIKVLVTATEWDNFFELRDHEAAQPEIRVLAQQMKKAFAESEPTRLNYGEWHLPFILTEEYDMDEATLLKASTARCARVSYLNHDGTKPNIEKDIGLYVQLVSARPIHASPCEHQAQAMTPQQVHRNPWSGNFSGWIQHRKLIESSFSS